MARFQDESQRYESRFPSGTSVRVRQTIAHRSDSIESVVTGVVESWEQLPTRNWHAQGKNGTLPLNRLKLRKADGERTLLVLDRNFVITALEAQPSEAAG